MCRKEEEINEEEVERIEWGAKENCKNSPKEERVWKILEV